MRLNLRALALVLGLCALGSVATSAQAQGYIRVTACGDPTPPAGAGNGYMDANGNICVVQSYANPGNFVSGVTAAMTATTSTSVIAAPAAGLRNYITQCTFSNSHATVGTMMNLQDGSGGTTIYSFPAAPAYGGATASFPTPLKQPTTATALFVVNATTGSNTFAACSGYKGP